MLWQNVENVFIRITNYQILIAMVTLLEIFSIGVPHLYMLIDIVMNLQSHSFNKHFRMKSSCEVYPKVHLIKKSEERHK